MFTTQEYKYDKGKIWNLDPTVVTGSKKVRTKIEPSADIDNCAAPTDFGNHLVGNVLIFFFLIYVLMQEHTKGVWQVHGGGVAWQRVWRNGSCKFCSIVL